MMDTSQITNVHSPTGDSEHGKYISPKRITAKCVPQGREIRFRGLKEHDQYQEKHTGRHKKAFIHGRYKHGANCSPHSRPRSVRPSRWSLLMLCGHFARIVVSLRSSRSGGLALGHDYCDAPSFIHQFIHSPTFLSICKLTHAHSL